MDASHPARRATIACDEEDPLARYSKAIEGDVVPRLLLGHRAGPLPPSVAAAAAAGGDRVEAFVRHVRGRDEAAGERFLHELLEEGATPEVLFLDVLAPAARRLGELWTEDECDFVEVTLALGRMQRALRNLSHLFLAGSEGATPVGRVLLSCLPGEQHTLGLVMVAEFFARAGWAVELGHPVARADLAQAVRDGWYDVVGFSVACDTHIPTLRREVRDLRRASRNPKLKVMVGGRAFDADPALVERVGADAAASDARSAPDVAFTLL